MVDWNGNVRSVRRLADLLPLCGLTGVVYTISNHIWNFAETKLDFGGIVAFVL